MKTGMFENRARVTQVSERRVINSDMSVRTPWGIASFHTSVLKQYHASLHVSSERKHFNFDKFDMLS